MYLREGIRAIKKNKFPSLIIIIQLTVAFLTFIAGVILVQDTLSQLIDFKKVFDENNTLYITYQAPSMIYDLDSDSEGELIEYYEKLLRDENISKVGISCFGKANYDDITDLVSISKGEEDGLTNVIYTDENFYKYINNIKLLKGRTFIEEDFDIKEGDIIPIIISKELEEYIPFGEIYLGKYEVIGVMKENNNLYYSNNGDVYSGVTQKKNTVIEPINYKDSVNKRQMAFGIMQETMITLKDNSLVEEYIVKLNDELKSICPIPLKVNKISDYKEEYINHVKGGIIATLALSSLLLIFSFFGIMGIILTSITRRKREFGIKLALGWTFKDICSQVITEISVLASTAFIISSLVSLILIWVDNFKFNIFIYLLVLVFMVMFTGIYSLIPISKIKKMDIVELIKDVK